MQKDKSIAKHLDETLFLYQSAPANHLELLPKTNFFQIHPTPDA